MAVLKVISFTGSTFTENAKRRMHWREQAALTREWRGGVERLLGDRSMRWRAPCVVGIEVYATCRQSADRGAYFPAAKAFIDGLTDRYEKNPYGGPKILVHTGWWPHDDKRCIAWENHEVPAVDRSLPTGLVRLELHVVTADHRNTEPSP